MDRLQSSTSKFDLLKADEKHSKLVQLVDKFKKHKATICEIALKLIVDNYAKSKTFNIFAGLDKLVSNSYYAIANLESCFSEATASAQAQEEQHYAAALGEVKKMYDDWKALIKSVEAMIQDDENIRKKDFEKYSKSLEELKVIRAGIEKRGVLKITTNIDE